MTLNPNRQATVGLEWAPNIQGDAAFALTPAPAAIIAATVSESISKLTALITSPLPTEFGPIDQGTLLALDLYDATDPTAPANVGPVVNYSDAPASDAAISQGHFFASDHGNFSTIDLVPTPGTVVLATAVNDDPDNPVMSNYIDYTYAGTASHAIRFKASTSMLINGVATSLTGRRIGAVHIKVRMSNRSTQYSANVIGVLGMDSTGSGNIDEQPQATYRLPANTLTTITWSWHTNPITGLPWTIGDIAQFQTGGAGDFGLRIQSGLDSQPCRIYAIELEIATYTETRIASASVNPYKALATAQIPAHDTPAGWVDLTLCNPATGTAANWAKTTGRTYWAAIWRPSGVGLWNWRYLDDGMSLLGGGSVNLPISNAGHGVPVGPSSKLLTRSFALTATIAGGSVLSVDGQPYIQSNSLVVSSAQTIEQELSDLASAPYGLFSIALRAPSATPSAPLDITVVDITASNTVVAGPASIVATDVGYAPSGPLLPSFVDGIWRAPFAGSFTPITGHRYGLVLASEADPATPWYVTVLDTVDNARAAVNYRGTTDAVIVGATRDASADLAGALQRVPATLTGFGATIYERPLDGESCSVSQHAAAQLVWAAADPGGPFGYYEVQRSDDDSGWQTIATLLDANAVGFYDFEARRGVQASYRTRQVRLDGAASAWTLPMSVVCPLAPEGGTLFATNVEPDLCQAYIIDGPVRPYGFLDAARTTFHPVFGRNLNIATRPLEVLGDQVTRTVVLGFGNPTPEVPGRPVFAPLVALSTAQLPYVCVLDDDGTRWYAALTCGQATWDEAAHSYKAQVVWTPISAVPAPPIVAWGP